VVQLKTGCSPTVHVRCPTGETTFVVEGKENRVCCQVRKRRPFTIFLGDGKTKVGEITKPPSGTVSGGDVLVADSMSLAFPVDLDSGSKCCLLAATFIIVSQTEPVQYQ
jgi:hypothetical protein